MATLSLSKLKVPKDYSLEETGLTQSLMGDALLCPMKFLISLNRFTSAEVKRTTSFGSAFHDLLELRYKNIDDPLGIDYVTSMDGSSEDETMKAKLQAVWEAYCEVYADEFSDVTEANPEVLIHSYHSGVLRRGKADGLILRDGRWWLLEHKTKAMIDEDSLTGALHYNIQLQWYVPALEDQFGIEIVGVIYNVIRNPMHKQSKSETLAQFMARVKAEALADPDHFFKRYELEFSAEDKRMMAVENGQRISVVRDILLNNRFFRNSNACAGTWKCQFIKACACGNTGDLLRKPVLFEEL